MTVKTSEQLTSLGIDSLYAAKILQDDANGFVFDTPFPLAPVGEVSGAPTLNEQTLYYDDAAFEVIQSEGKTERKIRLSHLAPEYDALLFGQDFDAVSGRVYDNAKPSAAPYFALAYRAQKSNGAYRYYWWLKGKFSKPATDHVVYGESADPKPQEVTYNAVKTIHKFALPGGDTDGVKRVWVDEDTDNADVSGWFDAVQTPEVASANALSCSPSPADAATGVAIDANVVLTFNNKIKSGNVGIVLVSDAGAVIAAAYSWDAAVKVLTINPSSNLSASTKYLVMLSGVTDIYGQVLANTVYDFTTA